jgi:hypothetical protein
VQSTARAVGRYPVHPPHPERICWGCDRHCAADDLGCGNGSIRALHPAELFGEDWLEWMDRAAGDQTESGKGR